MDVVVARRKFGYRLIFVSIFLNFDPLDPPTEDRSTIETKESLLCKSHQEQSTQSETEPKKYYWVTQ